MAARLTKRYRVTDGDSFRLSSYDPRDKAGLEISKKEGKALLRRAKSYLSDLQDLLSANATSSMLIVFQGMDAAGKDGTIRHVMSGVNPQGVSVTSFKQPGPQALLHGFLWRIHQAAPAAGRIGIFNRSQYEDVLVTRVHPEQLQHEHLPGKINTEDFWLGRYADISNFEHYLSRQGTVVLKFFLNISKKEQRKRLLSRLNTPEKQWKFSPSDLEGRNYWNSYQDAYQEAVRHTSKDFAPWIVVPADRKWFARLVVIACVIDALEQLGQTAPDISPDMRGALDQYRTALMQETN
ncbi:polyphosphate kinase 2 family protein [Acetobacter sp. AN02]|uniref:polyphosphate kinase 2 family protein n=1 Tax=Acetobacter sp. AN02 TaxID=2894186 RepID=UPI00243411B2|nr:polyphosphate kinase 2 family protein [Acetobacter sp. AN02]MDG6093744.1 polyphosphate kinase 2 family protein [Acetobacter sp. AN02]